MAYTTLAFLLFFAITACVYFAFPVKKYQWAVLLASSYVFYLWNGYRLAAFILLTTATVYGAGLLLTKIAGDGQALMKAHPEWKREEKKRHKERIKKKKRRLLILTLLLNFGILAFLKYFNFLSGSLNGLLRSFGLGWRLPSFHLLLPLGISFYTFQSTGYLIDVYRGRIEPERNFARFALFVSFFPQIIQGPIGFYDQLAKQLYTPHRYRFESMKSGLMLMLWGYFKKMVIADRAVILIRAVCADVGQYSGTVIFLTVLVYALQLYADFSGGIDISRGAAEVLGIRMAENFRRPYFAVSINDYWRRWHITLGAWMKNYVFYSLAMSKRFLAMGRKLKARYGSRPAGAHIAKVLPTCIATVVTFLLVGIWHGANWKYVAFGLWNGGVIMLSILLEPLFKTLITKLRLREDGWFLHIFRILRTFVIVLIGYVFDIAGGFSEAMEMMRRCVVDFSLGKSALVKQLITSGLGKMDYLLLLVCTGMLFTVSLVQERHPRTTVRTMLTERHRVLMWFALLFGILAVAVFGVYGPGYDPADFIYMQF